MSGHSVLFLSLDIPNERSHIKRKIKVLNEANFLQQVAGFDWSIINEFNKMEDNVKTFSSRIEEAMVDNTHVQTLKMRVLNHPWITKSIINSKHKKLSTSKNGLKARPWRTNQSIEITIEHTKR